MSRQRHTKANPWVQWSEDKIKADPFFGRSRVQFRVPPGFPALRRIPLLAVVETWRPLREAARPLTDAGGPRPWMSVEPADPLANSGYFRGRDGRGYGGRRPWIGPWLRGPTCCLPFGLAVLMAAPFGESHFCAYSRRRARCERPRVRTGAGGGGGGGSSRRPDRPTFGRGYGGRRAWRRGPTCVDAVELPRIRATDRTSPSALRRIPPSVWHPLARRKPRTPGMAEEHKGREPRQECNGRSDHTSTRRGGTKGATERGWVRCGRRPRQWGEASSLHRGPSARPPSACVWGGPTRRRPSVGRRL